MKIILFSLAILSFALCFSACEDDDDKPVSIATINASLTEINTPVKPYALSFTAAPDTVGEIKNVQNCTVRTSIIAEKSAIESIKTTLQGNKLNIEIVSSPDFCANCLDADGFILESCMVVHDVHFQLVGINKGEYDVSVGINNQTRRTFNNYMIR